MSSFQMNGDALFHINHLSKSKHVRGVREKIAHRAKRRWNIPGPGKVKDLWNVPKAYFFNETSRIPDRKSWSCGYRP